MIEYEVPYIGRGGIYDYILAIMDKYDISRADIARALGKNPRTVDGWFEKQSLAEKRFREIMKAFEIILTKQSIDSVNAAGIPSSLAVRAEQVADEMRVSLFRICNDLDALDLQTLENVAWSLYQQKHPYPQFYDAPADIITTDGDKDENGNVTTSKLIPMWCGDDCLYWHNSRREAIERAHAEGEALANETIETAPDDPSGGRWDVYERNQNDQLRADRAAEWRQWADTRPADMPRTPEFRQLLAILELEAPRDDQPGEAPMDPEVAQLSAILQAEALKDDPAADDAEEGAEPAQ